MNEKEKIKKELETRNKKARETMQGNGLKQFQTLTREQKELVMDFFKGHCNAIRCKKDCNNSPYEILNCEDFKKAYKQYLINKDQAIQTQRQAEEILKKLLGGLE